MFPKEGHGKEYGSFDIEFLLVDENGEELDETLLYTTVLLDGDTVDCELYDLTHDRPADRDLVPIKDMMIREQSTYAVLLVDFEAEVGYERDTNYGWDERTVTSASLMIGEKSGDSVRNPREFNVPQNLLPIIQDVYQDKLQEADRSAPEYDEDRDYRGLGLDESINKIAKDMDEELL